MCHSALPCDDGLVYSLDRQKCTQGVHLVLPLLNLALLGVSGSDVICTPKMNEII